MGNPTDGYRLRFLAVLCSISFLFVPALASADSSDSWQFHLAPYAWLAGQSGSVATLPGLPPVDIDINFYDDVLGNINGALMLVGEARKGRLGVVVDTVYTDIQLDNATPGKFFDTVSSRTTSWIVSGSGFYRLVEQAGSFIDGLVGLRYWSVDSELALSGGPAGYYDIDNRESWVDPIVGFKGLTRLGESRFYVNGFALIGGFGVGSDFMWDVNVNLGYQWTESFSTLIGYRYLDVDYEEDQFLYDVSQDGIILGLSWRF